MVDPCLDIIWYLKNASIGTLGTDIFVGWMPDDPIECIGAYVWGGTDDSQVRSDAQSRVNLQIRVAKTDYSAGYAKFQAIKDAVRGMRVNVNDITEHESRILIIIPDGEPRTYMDEKSRQVFSADFTINRTDVAGLYQYDEGGDVMRDESGIPMEIET